MQQNICDVAHQKGDFAGEITFFSLLFDVLEIFLSFKMTPNLLKLIKAFKFYNWKTIENSYSSFKITFRMFSSISQKAHSCKGPPPF